MADEAKIRALMELMNMRAAFTAMVAQQAKAWSADFADAEMADGFPKVFDSDEMLRRFAPIFAEMLDDETLNAALEFFSGPAGRRFVATQEKLMPRLAQIAHDYGLELAAKTADGEH